MIDNIVQTELRNIVTPVNLPLRHSQLIYFDTIFNMIDVDGSGEIDSGELGAFIEHMMKMNHQERESIIYHKEKDDAPVMVPTKNFIKFLEHSAGNPMDYEEYILRLFQLNLFRMRKIGRDAM